MTDSYLPPAVTSEQPIMEPPPPVSTADHRRTIIALTSAAFISIVLVALIAIFDVR